ncbi:DoxX family protein [Brevibacillus choshinensis]|uniref:DoxX family protein n=1 Tax=Brevibacillus choshinensis TaxID=54911 RepID=UPI002E2426AE|nr:DoxX family protein [Brevibacillus choshinensis]MED4753629.1 DoxX family protein [Brevibacillus choshinensis]MED4781940.1 DoxX family protein [Brevibacillus choshinensis]
MKKIAIIYWIFTTLMVALMGLGSIPDIMSSTEAVALFNHLGYPDYLLPFIGIAKLLGVVAILTPGFLRLKEWAYAGFVIDLTGAMYSSLAVGDPPSGLVFFLIGYLVIGGSYVYHHKRLKAAAALSISK